MDMDMHMDGYGQIAWKGTLIDIWVMYNRDIDQETQKIYHTEYEKGRVYQYSTERKVTI